MHPPTEPETARRTIGAPPKGFSLPAGSSPPEGLTLGAPVREDLLDLPFAGDLPGLLRLESGLLLDRQLTRLARLSGAIDRGLSLRLMHLHRVQGFHHLGYSCFSDYVRQRVDLAERTAQEMARLGRALVRLPLLDRALGEGRITWTAAVQVARVACPADEAEWVRSASTTSVRDLKQRVAQALSEGQAAEARPGTSVSGNAAPGNAAPGNAAPGNAAPGNAAPGNASPGNAAPDALAPGNSASGDVTPGDSNPGHAGVVHDVDATDASWPMPEQPDPCVRLSVLCSPRAARLWAAALELCRLMADAPLSEAEASEYLLADFLSGTDPAEEASRVFPLDPPLSQRSRSRQNSDDDTSRWCPSDELGPARVPLDELELSPETFRVLKTIDEEISADPFALDASLRALIAARRSLDLDLARMLRMFRQLNLARHVGFPSFAAYTEERLAISVHRANFLARLDRALTGLDATRRAIKDGSIGTVAALLIARVADEDSEPAWIERASKVTVLRLRKEVQWAEKERSAGSPGASPPSTGPLPSELQVLTTALLGDAAPGAQPYEGASAWVCVTSDANGETFAREDPSSARPQDEAVAQAVRIYREMFARDSGARWVPVEFWLRRSALSMWTEARHRLAKAAGSDRVEDRQVLYDVAFAFLLDHMEPWLDAVQHGDRIAVRDRFTCQIPGCTKRLGSGHHLRFVSQLGPDEPWNLLFVCWSHHLLGIHGGGWLRVWGRAPDALQAELGIHSRGAPLETWVRGRAPTRDEQAVA